jgi:hypothetical protein
MYACSILYVLIQMITGLDPVALNGMILYYRLMT